MKKINCDRRFLTVSDVTASLGWRASPPPPYSFGTSDRLASFVKTMTLTVWDIAGQVEFCYLRLHLLNKRRTSFRSVVEQGCRSVCLFENDSHVTCSIRQKQDTVAFRFVN